MSVLDSLLNVVERSPWPCPHCSTAGRRLEVYTTCARWACCGHTVKLPPLHPSETRTRACCLCTPDPMRAVA